MLRWMLLLLAASISPFGSVHAADLPNPGRAVYGGPPPPPYGPPVIVTEESDLLFTPSDAFPVIVIPPRTPLLLGSSTLPGYYGSTHSYDYQGPYYGGPNIDFRFKLPYACGVLGYC
jgi:hypothetical protein